VVTHFGSAKIASIFFVQLLKSLASWPGLNLG